MIKDIHFYCMCDLIYKHCNNILPDIISYAICPPKPDCQPSTRLSNLFTVTYHKSYNGKFILNNYSYRIWQSLPPRIKSMIECNSFLGSIKAELISNYT